MRWPVNNIASARLSRAEAKFGLQHDRQDLGSINTALTFGVGTEDECLGQLNYYHQN
jgi:hypothetical protein